MPPQALRDARALAHTKPERVLNLGEYTTTTEIIDVHFELKDWICSEEFEDLCEALGQNHRQFKERIASILRGEPEPACPHYTKRKKP